MAMTEFRGDIIPDGRYGDFSLVPPERKYADCLKMMLYVIDEGKAVLSTTEGTLWLHCSDPNLTDLWMRIHTNGDFEFGVPAA
jgi:hypothetical protein